MKNGSSPSGAESGDRKAQLRRQLYTARRSIVDREKLSERATHRLLQLLESRAAKTVMWYVDCRSELRTQKTLSVVLSSTGYRSTIVIPYCTETRSGAKQLGLWRLESLDELTVGKWSILEPPRARWHELARQVRPADVDAVVVPGVGFDDFGNRLGNGQGYYDSFLPLVRTDCLRIGLCYEVQVIASVGPELHDVRMDHMVTECRSWPTRSPPGVD